MVVDTTSRVYGLLTSIRMQWVSIPCIYTLTPTSPPTPTQRIQMFSILVISPGTYQLTNDRYDHDPRSEARPSPTFSGFPSDVYSFEESHGLDMREGSTHRMPPHHPFLGGNTYKPATCASWLGGLDPRHRSKSCSMALKEMLRIYGNGRVPTPMTQVPLRKIVGLLKCT